MEIKAVRGMHDLHGAELRRWAWVEERVHQVFRAFGYAEIRTPALEKIEVFKHAVGDETDIVEKQMYTIQDRAAHPDATPEILVLRPEGTAGFVRAVVEHQLHATGHPQRFYYYGPMFRYERPQKGRLRQFHQFGAELINDGSPEADAEVLLLLHHIYAAFGLGAGDYEIRLNSVGCNECRPAYRDALKSYFQPRLGELCEQCRKRFDRAPLRILDCKNESCKTIAQSAPLVLDHLCEGCRHHHSALKRRLDGESFPYVEDPRIVRGLDYYCRTAFEFTSPLLGAQSALGGGGRYDGLSAKYGKVSFPSVGWALGMERLVLALDAKGAFPSLEARPDFYLAPIGESAYDRLFRLAFALRRKGIAAEMSYEKGKGLKWLMKQSDRVKARYAVILGEDEMQKGICQVKNLSDGTQESVALDQLESELERRAKRAH